MIGFYHQRPTFVVEIESVGDFPEPRGSERVLCIDENDFAAGIARGLVGQLRRHAQRVRKLSLAGTELAERLRDGHALDPAADQFVQFSASRRNVITRFSPLIYLIRRGTGIRGGGGGGTS